MLIIDIPFQGNTRIPGTELGFNVFYKNHYLERNTYFPRENLVVLKKVNHEKVDDKVIQRINDHIQTGEATLFIGGSHATTAYIYENILREKDIPILIFDAHNDKGNTTETFYNWNVIDFLEKHVSDGCVLGYRYKHDMMTLSEQFTYKLDIDLINAEKVENFIIDWCKDKDIIYVSIDLDVLSPTEFPGVGFPVAGGISVTRLMLYISMLKKYSNKIIWDIVEYNPLIEQKVSELVIERLLMSILNE